MTPKERRSHLTQGLVRALLRYDECTGEFFSVERRSGVPFDAPRGTLHEGGYVFIKVGEAQYAAHRLAWLYMTGEWPMEQIDHKDGVRSNNAWANLREATHKQQRENSAPQKRSASGVRGVYWFKRTSKWRATISHNKQAVALGYHDTLIDAVAARLSAERRLFTHHRKQLG